MPSPAEAASELLRRRAARRSFAAYCMERGYWPARHHLHLIDALERFARGEIRRLMVFMPPGSAKSTYVSQLFPAWLLAQPTITGMPRDIIACSNTSNLAEEFSVKVRRHAMESQVLLGYLIPEEGRVDRWEVAGRGVYRCAGVGSTIAGQRGDDGLIDDPIRGSVEADSKDRRDKIFRWYQDDFRPRLKPLCGIAIVNTRWHDEDLSGRILPEGWNGESGDITARDGEVWRVICLPQIAGDNDALGRAPGEPLWPEWMDLAACEQARAGMSPRSWSALHQQQPSPDAGDYFKREWLGRYTEIPHGCRFFLASDFAVSEAEAADWTVHVVVGVDAMNRLYIADLWRGRGTINTTIDAGIDLVAKWKPACWLNEKGVILRVVGPALRARMRERNVMCPTEDYARTTSKAETAGCLSTEARGIQGRWSQGMVMLPEQAPWLADLEHELLRFPAGKHDDQVDALALIGLHLDKVVAPPVKELAQYRAAGWRHRG